MSGVLFRAPNKGVVPSDHGTSPQVQQLWAFRPGTLHLLQVHRRQPAQAKSGVGWVPPHTPSNQAHAQQGRLTPVVWWGAEIQSTMIMKICQIKIEKKRMR